jgi:hypothetical protein
MPHMTAAFASRLSRRWRTWLTAYALLAVAWPSTGPLPWMALDIGAHHLAIGAALDDEHAERDASGHEGDADVPGSPTHPLDHDCAQCQVLKHLARCVLPDPLAMGVAPAPGAPVVAAVETEPRCTSFIAARPPIRGPPLFRA